MPHRDYSHRDVVDKLGIIAGQVVVIADHLGLIDASLRARIEARAESVPVGEERPLDTVLVTVNDLSDPVTALSDWRERIRPNGAVWLLTPKRGRPGYVSQDTLIPAGSEAGMVDNKVCSVSDDMSAMRFVIRRRDR